MLLEMGENYIVFELSMQEQTVKIITLGTMDMLMVGPGCLQMGARVTLA